MTKLAIVFDARDHVHALDGAIGTTIFRHARITRSLSRPLGNERVA